MHNFRPASKMWPKKAFKPAHKAQNLIYLACLFHISILYVLFTNIYVLALEHAKKKKIWTPPRQFSFAPCYTQIFQKITDVYIESSYHSKVTICDSGVR